MARFYLELRGITTASEWHDLAPDRLGDIDLIRVDDAGFVLAGEGLLTISEDWTLHGATTRRLAEDLRPRVERAVEEDRHLTDRLLAGRSSPS